MLPDSSYIISSFLKKNLSAADKSYFSFLGNLPIPVLLADQDNLIRFCNGKVLELAPFNNDNFIDSPLHNYFSIPSEQIPGREFQHTLRTKKNKTFEFKIPGGKGKSIDLIVTARHTVQVKSFSLLELYFQVLPVQPNKTGFDSLESKFHDIEISASFGYWELNSKKTQFRGSKECLSLFGANSSQATISYIDLLTFLTRKEDKENIEKGLITIDGTNKTFHTEIKIKNSQNETIENRILKFFARWSPYLIEGMYSGIVQDITESKKIEKELLKAKEKAERADRLKSHFLTNLSYEIRNPMNAILGFAELLNLEDISKEQKLDYSRIIRVKGINLLAQIDEVTELSKFETGNITINKSEFELYPLLQELYDEFELKRLQLLKNSVKLELKLPDEYLNEKIFTDPGRLQQMLSNLLSNAIKFTEKGEVEFGYKKSGEYFKFYVKDTGIGIDEEDQNLIFNRFHELEETSSRKYGGGGLNLTISKHIVELLGGKIKVKSELNKGSRFQINIPIESPKRKKSDMTEFENLNTINWKDKVFLVAEDEDVNFRFLEAVLQKSQAQILRAKTGREAVELCGNISKIDLVLMDIKMPVMNGFEATKEIKRNRPKLPVIAQTAFAAKEEMIKCEQYGCDDVVTKPIDIKLLIRKISDLLH
jgi:signal transduction histidine kinase